MDDPNYVIYQDTIKSDKQSLGRSFIVLAKPGDSYYASLQDLLMCLHYSKTLCI